MSTVAPYLGLVERVLEGRPVKVMVIPRKSPTALANLVVMAAETVTTRGHTDLPR